jgi:hypothetical protein
VRGHVLTAALELLPLDAGGTEGRLQELPPGAIQLPVNHPRPADKPLMGWQGQWSRDPADPDPRERRAAAVRELLAAAPGAGGGAGRRAAGPIEVGPELGRALAAMRMLEGGGDAAPEVSLASLAAADKALGWTLPDAIVTLLASRVAYLEREWKLQVAALARNYKRGRNVVVAGLRPFAVAAGRKRWLCVRGEGADARLYLFNERGLQSVGPFELLEWVTRELSHLREKVRRRSLDGDKQAGALLRNEQELAETRFVPAIVA